MEDMADNEKSTRNIQNRDGSNTSSGQAQVVVEDVEIQYDNEKDDQIEDEEPDGNLQSLPLLVETGNRSNLGPGTESAEIIGDSDGQSKEDKKVEVKEKKEKRHKIQETQKCFTDAAHEQKSETRETHEISVTNAEKKKGKKLNLSTKYISRSQQWNRRVNEEYEKDYPKSKLYFDDEKKIKGVIQGFVQSKHLQIVQKQLITSGTPWDHSISIRKLYPETDYDMFFPFENFIAATKLFCPPFNIDRHSQRLVELSALHIINMLLQIERCMHCSTVDDLLYHYGKKIVEDTILEEKVVDPGDIEGKWDETTQAVTTELYNKPHKVINRQSHERSANTMGDFCDPSLEEMKNNKQKVEQGHSKSKTDACVEEDHRFGGDVQARSILRDTLQHGEQEKHVDEAAEDGRCYQEQCQKGRIDDLCSDGADEDNNNDNENGANLHVSVVPVDGDLNLFYQVENTVKCILCTDNFTLSENAKTRHSTMHKSNAIVIGNYQVLLCRKNCKNVHHRHCPFCNKIYNRRIDAEAHCIKCYRKTNKSTMEGENRKNKDNRKVNKKNTKEKSTSKLQEKCFKRASSHSGNDFEDIFRVQSSKKRKFDSISTSSDTEGCDRDRKEHPSVVNAGDDIDLFTQSRSTDQLKCKLCPKENLIPVEEVGSHKNSHTNYVIMHGSKKSFLCKLSCSRESHYHCCFCCRALARKKDAIAHIEKCSVKCCEIKSDAKIKGLYSAKQDKREKVRAKCSQCGIEMLKCNILQHQRTVHTEKPELVCSKSYSDSICIGRAAGIYLVQSQTAGPNIPHHVQKKIVYGKDSKIDCEIAECKGFNATSRLSKKPHFECKHVQSIAYNVTDGVAVFLTDDNNEVLKKVLKKETIKKIKEQKNLAKACKEHLVVMAEFENDTRRIHFSVFDNDRSHTYSKLGRVRVTYDKVLNQWFCVCCVSRSCMHQYISKWACLEKYPDIFGKIKENTCEAYQTEPEENDAFFLEQIQKTSSYEIHHKKIPVQIPASFLERSRKHEFPTELHPAENDCAICNSKLNEHLVTANAKILTKTGPFPGIETYQKVCPDCNMVYNYREYEDGVHNFNNRIILSLELCLHLRAMLSKLTAVSRVTESIAEEYSVNMPKASEILAAYLHFENLTDHQYEFTCNVCGIYPVKLCGDGNKKTLFKFSAETLPPVPEDFVGNVNCVDFWEDLSTELCSKAFLQGSSSLQVKPSLHKWTGWIGKKVRQSDIILNTEYLKIRTQQPTEPGQCVDITDEYLEDLIRSKTEAEIKAVCKECGISCVGSKSDLALLLRQNAKMPEMYRRILSSIKDKTGGWIALVCEHGITYAIKFLMRAESVRDYADLLLSFEHFPNIVCTDLAPRLASHTNRRTNNTFSPHDGCFIEPSDENVKLIKQHKMTVNLPWLVEQKIPNDSGGHPITGSSDHYSCLDRLHEKNWKADIHRARSLTIVQELRGVFNSQAAEQLNSHMGKNNYFLNMMTPSNQLFCFRLLLELHNVTKNRNMSLNQQKQFSLGQEYVDEFGRNLLGERIDEDEITSDTDSASEKNKSTEDLSESILEPKKVIQKDKASEKNKSTEDLSESILEPKKVIQKDKASEKNKSTEDLSESLLEPKKVIQKDKASEKNKSTEDLSESILEPKKVIQKDKVSEKNKSIEDLSESILEPKNVIQKDVNEGASTVDETRRSVKIRMAKLKLKKNLEIENERQKKLARLRWHDYKKTGLPLMPDIPVTVRERISNFTSICDSVDYLQVHSYAVKRSSLCTLKNNEWLDDQVINSHINLLCHEFNFDNEGWTKALHVDGFVMTSLLHNCSYTTLKKTRFADYKYVIIPCSLPGHWALLIIDTSKKTFQFLDSLNPGDISPGGHNIIKRFRSFSVNRTATINDINFQDFKVVSTPHNRQEDGYSCGIWVLMFVEQLIGGNITPKQAHVPYFRWYVAYKLYMLGKRKSEEDRTVCDIYCKAEESKHDTLSWVQCDREMCSNWIHCYCADLEEGYDGSFVCPVCSISKVRD